MLNTMALTLAYRTLCNKDNEVHHSPSIDHSNDNQSSIDTILNLHLSHQPNYCYKDIVWPNGSVCCRN